MANQATATPEQTQLGNPTSYHGEPTAIYGVMGRYDPKAQRLYMEIDCSPDAIRGAPTSKSGKSKLVGNTAGFSPIPGGPPGVSLSVCLTSSLRHQAG